MEVILDMLCIDELHIESMRHYKMIEKIISITKVRTLEKLINYDNGKLRK